MDLTWQLPVWPVARIAAQHARTKTIHGGGEKGPKGGPKGLILEVGARRAPELLVWYIWASGASFLIYTPHLGGSHRVLRAPWSSGSQYSIDKRMSNPSGVIFYFV